MEVSGGFAGICNKYNQINNDPHARGVLTGLLCGAAQHLGARRISRMPA
jgi:hypothetical protein